jgi:DNA-binding NtrC family response regulator
MVKHFYTRFAATEGKTIEGISPAASALLSDYIWPGNIRQLKNAIFRAVVLCENNCLDVRDFPQLLKDVGSEATYVQPLRADDEVMLSGHHLHLVADEGDFRTMYDLEKDIIQAAISHYKGCMSKVARKLGIGRSTLYRKLDEMAIDPRQSL